MMNKRTIVEMRSVCHAYSKQENVLKDVNIMVKKGDIYGFLGPNGSGKTTTLSLLLGLLNNQKGSIKIFGKDLKSNRVGILKNTGSLIESPSLYGHLTARENLEIYKCLYGLSDNRIDEVFKLVNLENTNGKIVKKFSLGMKQRLAIALALLPNPQLLILDEPTNGLDPRGIIDFRNLIQKLNKEEDMTFIISSHNLSEVERIATVIGIIYEGEMIFQGPLSELQNFRQKQFKIKLRTSDNAIALNILKDYNPETDQNTIFISFNEHSQIADVTQLLYKHNLDILLLQPVEQDLEQLFIELISMTNEPH